MTEVESSWVPATCTLPTVEQPPRVAEFDGLFAVGLRGQQRVSAQTVRWSVAPQLEAAVRDLVRREARCCSFFTFTLTPGPDALLVEVQVPAAQVAVLDALVDRATAALAKSRGPG